MNYSIKLDNTEMDALLDALSKGASRHESEARFYPRHKKIHDAKAIAMHKIKARLLAMVRDATSAA